MQEFELIDDIVKEPLGGAHSDPEGMAKILKRHIKKELADIVIEKPETRIKKRIAKYSRMGQFKKVTPVI